MSKVEGWFSKPGQLGLVRTRVYFSTGAGQGNWMNGLGEPIFPVTFEIHTGFPYLLLIDEDFLRAIWGFGYRPDLPYGDDPLLWAIMHPRLFACEAPEGVWTVGGRTPMIFRIKGAWLRFCNRDGRAPERGEIWWPVYGSFSAGFLYDDNCPEPRYSIMGRSLLNQIKGFKWCGPSDSLVFYSV